MQLIINLTKDFEYTKNRRKKLLLDQLGIGDYSSKCREAASIYPVKGYNNLCMKNSAIYESVVSSLKNTQFRSGMEKICFVSLRKPKFTRPLYTFKYVLIYLLLQAFPKANFWNMLKFAWRYKLESKHYIDQKNFDYECFYIDYLTLHGKAYDIYFSDSIRFLTRVHELFGASVSLVYLSRSPYIFDHDTNLIRLRKDEGEAIIVGTEKIYKNNYNEETSNKTEFAREIRVAPSQESFLINYNSLNLGNGLYAFNFSVCLGNVYKALNSSILLASVQDLEGNQYVKKIVSLVEEKKLTVHFKFDGVKFKSGAYLFNLKIANKDSIIHRLRFPIYLQTTLDSDIKSTTPYI